MKSKDEDNKFVPWEKERSEKKAERGGGIPPLTSIKSRVQSKPKSEDHEYLDMYIMLREKERLEKYGKTLGRQHRNVAESWKDTKRELLKRQEALPKVSRAGVEDEGERTDKEGGKKKRTSKDMKKIDWNY